MCGGSSRLVSQPTWGYSAHRIFRHRKEGSPRVFWHLSWKLGTSRYEKRRDQHRCHWVCPFDSSMVLGSQLESTMVRDWKDILTNKPVCFLLLRVLQAFATHVLQVSSWLRSYGLALTSAGLQGPCRDVKGPRWLLSPSPSAEQSISGWG